MKDCWLRASRSSCGKWSLAIALVLWIDLLTALLRGLALKRQSAPTLSGSPSID